MVKKCDNCNKIVVHGEKVVAIVPDVEICNRSNGDEARLKLSQEAIEARSVRIYCSRCLTLDSYLVEPTG